MMESNFDRFTRLTGGILVVALVMMLIMLGFDEKDKRTLNDSPVYTATVEARYDETRDRSSSFIPMGGMLLPIGGGSRTTYYIYADDTEHAVPKSDWLKLPEGTTFSYQLTEKGNIGNITIIKSEEDLQQDLEDGPVEIEENAEESSSGESKSQ